MKKCLLVFMAAFLLTSCFTTKVFHGNLTTNTPVVEVSKEWNHHIIFGLVPLGTEMEAKKYVGERTNYMVQTNQTFLNLLVNYITAGIYTPTTTTFYAPLDEMGKKN